MNGFLRREHWAEAITVHRAAAELARQAGDLHAEADALADLGHLQELTADFVAATASITRAMEIYRGVGSQRGEAKALSELGVTERLTGRYAASAASLTAALRLFRSVGDLAAEALDQAADLDRQRVCHAAPLGRTSTRTLLAGYWDAQAVRVQCFVQ
jgi:tetratricopeptide (TPR) repeat protein